MAGGGGRAAMLGAAAAAFVLGGSAGWLFARAAAPAPPPPPVYVNPLADARKDETLVILDNAGTRDTYRVVEADAETVLLSVEKAPQGQPVSTRQLRVARTFVGALVILGGDEPPESAEATIRDFTVEKMEPDEITVDSLGRTFKCWKVTGRQRAFGKRTYWITDELPVHGVVRVEGERGMLGQVDGYSFGPGH